MTTPDPLDRAVPRPRLALLAALAVALGAAVLLAPFPLASVWPGGGYPDLPSLRDAVGSGFVRFRAAGGDGFGDLTRAAGFWGRFHIVKAGLAGLLLLVLGVVLARVLRQSADAATRGRRRGLALAGAVLAPLTVLALLLLVANLQGAVAPLSSVLGLLPLAAPQGPLAAAVRQARQDIASGARTPAEAVLLHDFAVYHAAMSVLGAIVTAGLFTAAVVLWRRRTRVVRRDRRRRRMLALTAVALVGLGAVFGLITAANVSTTVDPAPALIDFFAGGA